MNSIRDNIFILVLCLATTSGATASVLPTGCMGEYVDAKSFAGYSPTVIALAQIGREYTSVPCDLPGADETHFSMLPAAPAAMTLAICGLCCIMLLRGKTALKHAHLGIGCAGAYGVAMLLNCVKGPAYADELNVANMAAPDLCRRDECAGQTALNYIGLLYRIGDQSDAHGKSNCTSGFDRYALRQSLVHSRRSFSSLHLSSTIKYLINSEPVLCQPARFNFNVWTNQAYILAQLTRGPP